MGLGNPILTDDGVGVKVAREVATRLPPEAPVEVVEASVGGLRLMEMMVGYARVILIDALYHPDVPPGSVHRITLQDLANVIPYAPEHLASAHDTSLLTALEMGRRLGLALPDEVVIYAIGAQDVLTFGETLTPAVASAVPDVVAAVVGDVFNKNACE